MNKLILVFLGFLSISNINCMDEKESVDVSKSELKDMI